MQPVVGDPARRPPGRVGDRRYAPEAERDAPLAATSLAIGLAVLLLTMMAVFVGVGHPRYHLVWIPFAYVALAMVLGLLRAEFQPAEADRLPPAAP